jgi:hypothetical protein
MYPARGSFCALRRFPPPWSVEELDARTLQPVDIHHTSKTMLACSLFLISQLRAVWAAANVVEKRGIFLGRLIAQLQLRGFRFTNADLDDVVRSALTGLIQGSAA